MSVCGPWSSPLPGRQSAVRLGISMPVMNGYDVVEAIRSLYPVDTPVVIALTC